MRVPLTLYFALFAIPTLAETISPSDAPAHVGEHVTVEGVVTEVYHARSERVTFIDIGGRFPNQVFTAVIFAGDAAKFANIDSLQGKTIDISGTIILYKQILEIILNDAEQVKVK